jgi:hypothetical protein
MSYQGDNMLNLVTSIKTMMAISAVLLFVSFFGLPAYKAYFTDETVTAKIEKAERVGSGEDSRYLIFTDGEVFENTDTLLRWKFNSSDVYGEMKVGSTCTLTVNGWRMPFFSVYRNVLEAHCG